MKARDRRLCMNLVSLAVRGVLVASIAAPSIVLAQDNSDDDVKALTMPTNFVQAGGEYNSKASDKFGEYSGLYKKGPTFLGDLSIAGGDGYGRARERCATA